MRQRAWRQRIPVVGGCLLAALALALLSLVIGARSAHRPVPAAVRTALAQATGVLRPDAGRVDGAQWVPAQLDRAAPPAVPCASFPTALVLAATVGVLAVRARRAGRSARPDLGVPTGRGPPAWVLAT